MLATAALGGAVGSIASQGVAIAMGMQDSFSWKGVAMSAIGAGAASGVGAIANAGMTAQQIATTPVAWSQAALRAGGASVATQGVGSMLGISGFSWKAVAASAAGAGASSALGSTGWMNGLNSVAAGTVRGLVSGGIQAGIFGTRPNWGSIAAQSFGQALGDSYVESVRRNEAERQKYSLTDTAKDSGLMLGNQSDGLRLSAAAAGNWSAEVDAGIDRAATLLAISDGVERLRQQMAQAAGDASLLLAAGTGFSLGNSSRDAGAGGCRGLVNLAPVGTEPSPSGVAGSGLQLRDETAQYDALGNYSGTTAADPVTPTMGYRDQMRNLGRFVGDLGIGAVKGLDNLIPETLAFGYRMTGYAAAGVVSLFNTDASDRTFAQYERVTGRVFGYDNGAQAFGGLVSQLTAPTLFKGFSLGGEALYEFEQSAKSAINDKARHWLPGSSSVLQVDTTFYAYKNSKYLQAQYKPLELWMTPDLMTSRDAVQKLATPFAKGYDTLLTVTLPARTKIVSPRSVWSMYGRPGGGTELRAYSPVTQDMWQLNTPPR